MCVGRCSTIFACFKAFLVSTSTALEYANVFCMAALCGPKRLAPGMLHKGIRKGCKDNLNGIQTIISVSKMSNFTVNAAATMFASGDHRCQLRVKRVRVICMSLTWILVMVLRVRMTVVTSLEVRIPDS